MGDLEQYQQDMPLLARDARRSSRAVSRAGGSGLVRRTSVDLETEVTLSKIDSNTAVTGAQMAAIARVAQAQVQFEQLTPQASARLNMVADNHALIVVADGDNHQRKLRRI